MRISEQEDISSQILARRFRHGFGRLTTVALALVVYVLLFAWAPAVQAQFKRRPELRLLRIDGAKPPGLRLYVADLDATHHPVRDRKRQNYRLLIDGVPSGSPSKVHEVSKLSEPLAVSFVIQVSAPLRDVFTEAIESAGRLLDSLPAGSQAGLVAYTDVIIQETKPTDPSKVKNALDDLRIHEDAIQVHLPDALRDALEALDNPKLPARRAIVVISDGLTANLNFQVFADLGRRCRDKDVAVYSIGYAPLEPRALRTLYKLSGEGGGTFREAKDGAGMRSACAELVDELAGLLVLTYDASQAFDGKLHDFQIELPEGRASNIVSVELKKHAVKKPKEEAEASPWLVFALVGLGIVLLTVSTWLVFRAHAQKSGGKVNDAYYEDDDEDGDDEDGDEEDDDGDEDDDDDDEDGDDDEPEEEDTDHEPVKKSSRKSYKKVRIRVDEEDDDDPYAAGPRSVGGSANRRHDAINPNVARQNIDELFARGSARPEPRRAPAEGAVEPASAPRPAPSPLRPASNEPAADGRLPLPAPGAFLAQRQPAQTAAPARPAGGAAFATLPHPDEYIKNLDPTPEPEPERPKPQSPLMPGNFSLEPAVAPRDEGAASAPAVRPIDQAVVAMISASEAGPQPGRLLDRKTQVMAVEEIQEVDFSAWVVPLGETGFTTVAVHDGFTIGDSEACDFVLTGEDVADNEASIVLDSRGYRLDTRGTRGALMQPLNDGTIFYIGPREFLFKVAARFPERHLGAARLEVLNGMDRGRALSLQNRMSYVVGSHVSCKLVVRGEKVGSRHAVFLREDKHCIVADLGTESGVLCQGEPMGQRKLSSGEEVTLGSIRLVFTIEDGAR